MTSNTASSEKTSGEVLATEADEVTSPTTSPAVPTVPPPSNSGRRWPSRWTSLVVAAAFAMGSGNLWQLPALCLRHGGGVFLVQFLICFIFAAVPMLLMETALGQFSSKAPLSLFAAMTPVMKGLAGSMCFILVVRYTTVAVWVSHAATFLAHSLSGIWSKAPWNDCLDQDEKCYDARLSSKCLFSAPSPACSQFHGAMVATRGTLSRSTPFIHYAATHQLMIPSVVSEFAAPSIDSIISLFLVWLSIGSLTFFGKHLIQRTAWLALFFPLLVYTLMLINGLCLDSSQEGLAFLFDFDPDKFLSLEAWTDAAAQAILALNLACGAMIHISSLREFSSPLRMDVLVVSTVALFGTILVTITTFLYVGHFAALLYPEQLPSDRIRLYMDGDEYIQAVFPEVLSSSAWIFCSLYFAADLLLGAQTMMTCLWVVVCFVRDRHWAAGASWKPRQRGATIGILALGGMAVGLLFVVPGGLVQLFVVDRFISYATLIVSLFEICTVSYLYGFKRFIVNIRTMVDGTGPLSVYWWLDWLVLTPLLLLACVLMAVLSAILEPSSWLSVSLGSAGWTLCVSALVPLTGYGCYYSIRSRQHRVHWKTMFQPTGSWGPEAKEDREKATRMERAVRVR